MYVERRLMQMKIPKLLLIFDFSHENMYHLLFTSDFVVVKLKHIFIFEYNTQRQKRNHFDGEKMSSLSFFFLSTFGLLKKR